MNSSTSFGTQRRDAAACRRLSRAAAWGCTTPSSIGSPMEARMLSEKELRFVTELLRDLSPAAAALRSGYSPRTGARLLARPHVRAKYERQQSTQNVESALNQQTALREAGRAMELAEHERNPNAMVAAVPVRRPARGSAQRQGDEGHHHAITITLSADDTNLL